MTRCPICSHLNIPGQPRCAGCGADFFDPDVRAAIEAMRAADSNEPLGEAGVLASDRFLRVPMDSLDRGPAARKLALVGGLALVALFFFPVTSDFQTYLMPWEAARVGPTVALLFPLAAGVLGVALALAPHSQNRLRLGALALVGLGGLLVCLPGLGRYAGAPEEPLWLYTLGLWVGGAALAVRVSRPTNPYPRYALLAAAVLCAAGLLVPAGNVKALLPSEYAFYVRNAYLGDEMPMRAILDGLRPHPLSRFPSLLLLLPLIVFPVAAVLAWKIPTEIWDRGGLGLRPLGWLAVLFVPLFFGLLVFNLLGWSGGSYVVIDGVLIDFERYSSALMIGRTHLGALATVFVFWATFGAAGLFPKAAR